MGKVSISLAAVAVAGAVILSADWASAGGNAQRDGWARGEKRLSPGSAANGGIKWLYSFRLDPKPQDSGSPIALSSLIGWKGFKSLLFIGGASDVYAIDSDLGRPYFRTRLGELAASTPNCPGAAVPVVMNGGRDGKGGARAAFGASGGGASGGHPARGQHSPPPAVWAVGPDGNLYTIRQQDGDDKATPPVKFVPPGSRVADLLFHNDMVYATTQGGCGGHSDALYAIDIATPDKKVVEAPGSMRIALSSDGDRVYASVSGGRVAALDGQRLSVKDYFAVGASDAAPAVFAWKDRDAIVSAGSDGRIYLLDSASLGGPDHRTPLAHSEVFATAITGAFSTWVDSSHGNARWIYASVSGPVTMKFPVSNGAAASGAVVAFRVEEQAGKTVLTPRWISRNLIAPAAPAVTNGLVFALSRGKAAPGAKNAVLYALDSRTGREIWSSGDTAGSYATGGIAIDSSMVFFTTHDSTVNAYGIPIIF